MNQNSNLIFEKKNVVVTGGAGFIGSHLCERLLREAKVICIDDLSNSNIHNIDHLLQYPDFEFIKYDSNQPIDLEEFSELNKFKVKFQGIQEVYNLACPTSPKNFEQDKIQLLLANSYSVISALNLALKYRAKYVFASSSVVYGIPLDNDNLSSEKEEGIIYHLSPRACYDEGKRFAETCVETYRQVYNLDAKIARIFTTYGPRMKLRDGLLIPDFILNALEGKDLVIYGQDNVKQAMCYVTDIVDGMVKLMHSGTDVSLVNLGNEMVYTMSEVAQKIIELTKSLSKILVVDAESNIESAKVVPDLSYIKESLHWMPLVRLEDGLKKTIDYAISHKEMFQPSHL